MKYDKQICPICGRPLVKHGLTTRGEQKFFCKCDRVEFVPKGEDLIADSGEVFKGAFTANQGQTRQQARDEIKAEETRELYAEISRVLTDFESQQDSGVETAADLYYTLVKVQNWFAANNLDQ